MELPEAKAFIYRYLHDITLMIPLLIVAAVLNIACADEAGDVAEGLIDQIEENILSCPPTDACCLRSLDFPPYNQGDISDAVILEPRRLPTDKELGTMADTYECLLDRQLITEAENICLMNDLDKIRIVVLEGMGPSNTFRCGDGTTRECIRRETLILETGADENALVFLSCLRASQLTIGQMAGPDHPWLVEGQGDSLNCICESGW